MLTDHVGRQHRHMLQDRAIFISKKSLCPHPADLSF